MARNQLTSWFIVIKNLKMTQCGYIRAAALLDGEDIHISLEQVPGDPVHAHIILDTTCPPSIIRKMLKMDDGDFIEPCYDKAASVDYIQKIGKYAAKAAYTSIPDSYEHYDFDACAALRDEIQREKDAQATAQANRRRRIRRALRAGVLSQRQIAENENISLSTVKRIAATMKTEKSDATPQENRGEVVHRSRISKIIMFPTPAKIAANVGTVRVCAAAPSIAAAMPLYTRISNNANPAPRSIPKQASTATSSIHRQLAYGYALFPHTHMLPATASAIGSIPAKHGELVGKSMRHSMDGAGKSEKIRFSDSHRKTAHSTSYAQVA